ncbi:hypothetical protein CSB89_2288 [Pseudomonas aeruginosa]|nr:hypothetical protein CSB89_2288 [Pseudomonas aeruginosa]
MKGPAGASARHSIRAALIRMEQHLLWLAALFVGHCPGP